ncbi:FAD:protein FMN transferase [Oxalobacter formigenes]|uniref:FAD:protein FMN transferase n=1 Tax=Oxalobacter formigenes OXCC13 TaxID=556269 RepID=C3X8F3_OXAFO|nr:FAD:protein FMN transferase [Oxalobacter formigenes]ARQ46481.1 FAD:protein FMN transferase [Oxalobacter formigenes]ARQ78579.1 thiamine biosynthesis protein ApbE [Oxalobacter formigenes OXCC13]EEO29479.1 ApbE family protein [Oxalobacter formigenes OXCC13]MCZ4061693.1 FAD:protein FMN transferase [Oxalobacter formigenes]QDX32845.1 FAD:protein FMN transferase [Oxalobacter formigenes]
MDEFLYKVQTRFLFHSSIRIKIPAICSEEQMDSLFGLLESVDKRYNSYQAGSFFDRINKNAGSFVTVDDETVRILRQAKKLSGFFDGRYAITVMPLVRLWGFYKDDVKRVPSEDELAQVLPLVNDGMIDIDGNRVRIAEGQEIVTGSFIKAYAVDRLVEKMREMKITDAIVNAGGSTMAAVNNAAHPSWQVGVDVPGTDDPLFVTDIANGVYSTSAQGDSFVEIGGKRYGHILNPQTGYPSSNKMVGVVTESAMLGDMVSTGLFNESAAGFLEKMQLLQKDFSIEGFLMDEAGNITRSAGFGADWEVPV